MPWTAGIVVALYMWSASMFGVVYYRESKRLGRKEPLVLVIAMSITWPIIAAEVFAKQLAKAEVERVSQEEK